jgi:putative nucleotidyltransferase with HDIG domain
MSIIARRLAANPFTRRDAVRLFLAATILVAGLTAALSIDLIPSRVIPGEGDVAPTELRAPRATVFTSEIATQQARADARRAVEPQYDYDLERGRLSAARQVAAFDRETAPIDAAFEAVLPEDARAAALAAALPRLSEESIATLQSLRASEWRELRDTMRSFLDRAQRQEVRDSELAVERQALVEQLPETLSSAQRELAAEILSPLLVANSSYSAALTEQARQAEAAAVEPVELDIQRNEVIVRSGQRVTALDVEKLRAAQLLNPRPDPARFLGWFLLAVLTVGLLLGWVWRFRLEFWHRNNALLLIGLLLVGATFALKVTADRSILPYFVPTAAVGLLLAVLLSSTAGMIVMAVLGVLAATVTGSVEMGAYVFLGGFAGVIVVRRGERIGNFIRAAVAMALVNLAVVAVFFVLLSGREVPLLVQLVGASLAAAGGSALAAIGSFAVLGNLFGITTSFQLLELANPSQPLLRRLLIETPGTYHHSLMVGNLAERAAEAIGADPLLTRVAAYYHDVGKLANPLAFIENQAGEENIHDELSPQDSATVLKAHVANGIDLAYENRLPKAIIAFIPQHHGTALMSYFYARAREQAREAAGAAPGTPAAAEAEASVDPARFRHAGPRPQSREAALIMLADGVEASVRSLTDHSEPSVRAMVERIIAERLQDGQFDECDLTLRDLEQVKGAFVAQLLGMYHRRIEYPQNKIVELESRRVAGGRGPSG